MVAGSFCVAGARLVAERENLAVRAEPAMMEWRLKPVDEAECVGKKISSAGRKRRNPDAQRHQVRVRGA